MNTLKLIAGIGLAVLYLGGATPAIAAGDTARAGLKVAAAAAQKWQADAVLTNVTTQAVAADGKAGQWGFLFYSPKTKQAYSVSLRNGRIAEQHPVGPHLTDPVGEFVDSEAAVKAAQANGLKVTWPSPMNLMVMGQKTRNAGAYWMIGTGYTPGEVSVLIEARSGKFFRKEEHK